MSVYKIREVFKTIQGEGLYSGLPCAFVRFAGCNMWRGTEKTRVHAKGQCGIFCDTDFRVDRSVSLSSSDILAAITKMGVDCVVLTGGEPLLQLDIDLLEHLKKADLRVHIETNGTRRLNERSNLIDWVTVSPKMPENLTKIERADELKFAYPTYSPENYKSLITNLNPTRIYIQPIDGLENSLSESVAFVLDSKHFFLSTQSHKIWGLP